MYGRKNAVGFRLWIRCHRLWHWDCCQSRPQFKPLDTKRQTWQWNGCYGSGGIFMFNPGLKIGQIIKNADIVGIILKAKILRSINISGVN